MAPLPASSHEPTGRRWQASWGWRSRAGKHRLIEGRLRGVWVRVAYHGSPVSSGKNMGAPVKLKGFLKFEVGEGIEKAVTDFAAEVASFSQPKQ